jgi:hypothetical protein
MDRTERFYKIDQLLEGGRGISFHGNTSLPIKLDVSPKECL